MKDTTRGQRCRETHRKNYTGTKRHRERQTDSQTEVKQRETGEDPIVYLELVTSEINLTLGFLCTMNKIYLGFYHLDSKIVLLLLVLFLKNKNYS